MSTFLVDKEPGFGETAQGITVPGKIEKMGYKGVDTTELVLDGHRTTSDQILGGEPGRGFYQMMDGVEVGRVNVAARGLRGRHAGVRARHRLRPAAGDLRQEDRRAPGRAVPAGRDGDEGRGGAPDDGDGRAYQGLRPSATTSRRGWRSTWRASTAQQVVEDAFRIHGGYGYSKEYEIERLYREAPMLLIGEGTADIQRMIIGRRLLEEYRA